MVRIKIEKASSSEDERAGNATDLEPSMSELSGSDAERPAALRRARRLAAICAGPECGASGAGFRCGRCRAVRYCSKRCQRLHWSEAHAVECSELHADKELWTNPDVLAVVLSGLPARAACHALAVCPLWRRCGPYVLQAARWRGHPAARRLRSRPHGAPSWRKLHVAETTLLFEDFNDGNGRWQQLPADAARSGSDCGRISAPGFESSSSPIIAASLVHRLPRSCRPKRLRAKFRCAPGNEEARGRCAAYIVLGEHESCWDRDRRLQADADPSCAAAASKPPAAFMFFTWSLTTSRGFGRRVVGLLGDGATHPMVDETAPMDVVEIDLRLSWSRISAEGQLKNTVSGKLHVGAFGRIVGTISDASLVKYVVLGVSPGSSAEFLEIQVT